MLLKNSYNYLNTLIIINYNKKKMNKVKQIFKEIEEAIERTKSPVPVPIAESKLIKELKKIKDKYENRT